MFNSMNSFLYEGGEYVFFTIFLSSYGINHSNCYKEKQ